MSHFLFSSESVAIGHPDKIADQISDAILDACLEVDPASRVACETLVSTGLVLLAGEITTKAHLDYQTIVRKTIKEIGYDNSDLGFDYRSCAVIVSLNKQSTDIAQGVNEESENEAGEKIIKEQGAGDQGLMFGYACNETPELMPLPIMLSHKIMLELKHLRENKTIKYLRPDAKCQVTVEYDEDHNPVRLHTVVISTQHNDNVSHDQITQDMKALVNRLAPKGFIDSKTIFYVNPTGRFVIGGPTGDCGLTGRKIIVDTYGGMGRHGGGAFSGKDPSKVDRSACYGARYVAKNVVAAKLASRCEVQVSYAIGISRPLALKVDTFGTGVVSEEILQNAISATFDLSPKGLIQMLNLRRPIYRKTAFGGHFGRNEPEFTWEKTDRAQALLNAVEKQSALTK